MQRPTCTGLRVRSTSDAHIIFHAVSLKLLPMTLRRLDTEERRAISSGCVYVWEERGPHAEATGLGIERWTDSIRWGPSRVRDEFLFYHEKEPTAADLEINSDSDTTVQSRQGCRREILIKQTYSVFVDTVRGRRKWHLIAYFTQDTLDYLGIVDNIPALSSLEVPPGVYKSARSSKTRREPDSPYEHFVAPVNQCYPPNKIQTISAIEDKYRNVPPSRPYAGMKNLAPLAYLQNIPPPRRHPMDEKALMSLTAGLR